MSSGPRCQSMSNQSAYGEFLTCVRLKSGAPSFHHAGPRSPRPTWARETSLRAAAIAASSPEVLAAFSARRPLSSSRMYLTLASAGSDGFGARHRRPWITR